MAITDYHAKRKYAGEIARDYDRLRQDDADRYAAEDELIGEYIASLPEGAVILDAPIGTGRFIPNFQERECAIHGVDISQDMLDIATEKARQANCKVNVTIGDITDLHFDDATFDYFVCNKFIKWLPDARLALRALGELRRVSRHGGIVEIRCVDRPFLELFGRYASLVFNLSRRAAGKKIPKTKIYSKKQARRILRSAGFNIESERELSNRIKKSIYFTVT